MYNQSKPNLELCALHKKINISAPELIYNNQYSEKSDIFALGCFIYELYTFKKAYHYVAACNMNEDFKSNKYPKFYNNDNMFRQLVLKMINYDVCSRLTLQQLKDEVNYLTQQLSQPQQPSQTISYYPQTIYSSQLQIASPPPPHPPPPPPPPPPPSQTIYNYSQTVYSSPPSQYINVY